MQPPIFCQDSACGAFIGAKPGCTCGWSRAEPLPAPGQPLWTAEAGGPVATLSLVEAPDGALLLAGLGQRGEGPGALLALDPATGLEGWRFTTAGLPQAAVVSVASRLVLGDEAGYVYALDACGRPAWPQPLSMGAAVRWAVTPDPANDVLVYAAPNWGGLTSIDVRRGSIVQRWPLPDDNYRPATPLLALGDWLLLGAAGVQWVGGALLVWRRDSRRLVASYELDADLRAMILLAEGRVLLALSDGSLRAVEVRDGRSLWIFRAEQPRPGTGEPLVCAGNVYMGSHDHHLYALDAGNGTMRWRFDARHGLVTSPRRAGSAVCIGDNRGRLWAVDCQSGHEAWVFTSSGEPTAGSLLAGPLVWQDRVYVGWGGQIVALPWHLGAWETLAAAAGAAERGSEAAGWWALAGQAEKAAECFLRGEEHEKAARIYETCPGHLRDAALAWEQAAQRAEFPAWRWQQAARVWQALQEPGRARDGLRQAALALGAPYLDVEVTGRTAFKVGQQSLMQLRIINQGKQPAFSLEATAQGEDWALATAQRRPELAAGDAWQLTLQGLQPLKAGTLLLRLVVSYADRSGNPGRFDGNTCVEVADRDQSPIYVDKWFASRRLRQPEPLRVGRRWRSKAVWDRPSSMAAKFRSAAT
jgi:outer membrane protein assembly factor BamB